jgi:acyl carrier protein
LPEDFRVDTSLSLFDAGLDSLGAVELRNILSKHFNRRFDSTLLFDHPTIEALVRFLAPEEKKPSLPVEDSMAAEVDQLSEEEAEALLLLELNRGAGHE